MNNNKYGLCRAFENVVCNLKPDVAQPYPAVAVCTCINKLDRH